MSILSYIMWHLIYVVIPPSYIAMFAATRVAEEINFHDHTPARRYVYSMLGLCIAWEAIFFWKLNGDPFYGAFLYFLAFSIAVTTAQLAKRNHHDDTQATRIEIYKDE